jgi:hypothetical protein
MSRPLSLHAGVSTVAEVPGVGIIIAQGVTVPTDADPGYAPGCIFIHVDGTDGSALYVNEGTVSSADFNLITVAAA